MNLGVPELIIIALVLFALFGYKKLPDATRSIGRSLRIFKGEMQGMKDDDVKTRAEAQTVRAPLQNAPEPPVQNAPSASAPQQPAPQGRVDEPGEYRAS